MFNPEQIEKFKRLKTPFYYYDISLLQKTIDELKKEADKRNYQIHYAVKANANEGILQIINDNGFGADCVSGNEVSKSIEVGFDSNKIVFAGVGKSDEEIKTGLQHEIFCFNVESIQEIEVINSIAGSMNKTAPIALRINPNINPKTHHYITTGLEENKFGINFDDFDQILGKISSYKNLVLTGLHFHIGSQVTDLEVYKSLCIRINELQKWFVDHNIEIKHLNAGGGLGVNYENPDENLIPDFKSFFRVFEQFLELQPDQILHFEIGRAVVAQCGSLISKVLFIKEGLNTNFAILDAGMTELLRPALYQAYHKIENLTSIGKEKRYDVVGPICESSDTFAKSYILPETKRGDLISLRSTGAYGEVMASHYNLRSAIQSYFSDQL
ncbi:diaminopimelate decarboxylase [bacterium BMS3Abin03]|nr:diaminopimelate decarboxylase [bacterium BMS3Abin03]MCG6959510.1 diaminopimelate decarboxylase [bacterium BMS3Abin03]